MGATFWIKIAESVVNLGIGLADAILTKVEVDPEATTEELELARGVREAYDQRLQELRDGGAPVD